MSVPWCSYHSTATPNCQRAGFQKLPHSKQRFKPGSSQEQPTRELSSKPAVKSVEDSPLANASEVWWR